MAYLCLELISPTHTEMFSSLSAKSFVSNDDAMIASGKKSIGVEIGGLDP